MSRFLLLMAWLEISGLTFVATAADLVRPAASYAYEGTNKVILILFEVKSGDTYELAKTNLLDRTAGEPYEAKSYELKDADGNSITVIPIQPRTTNQLVRNLRLRPAQRLNPERDYTFRILPKKLVFRLIEPDGTTNTIENSEARFTFTKDQIKRVEEFQNRGSSGQGENNISLLGGSPGGAGSARIIVDRPQFLGVDWMNLRLEGRADFTLDNDKRDEFFNHIAGEASFYRTLFIGERYSEVSFHGKTESDQSFDITDGLLGVQYAIYPRDPVTAWLSRIFVENDHAGPLVVLGYDYVQNLAGDGSATADRNGVNTERADHRVNGLLRWRIPVARAYDFSFVPALAGRYDVDIDLELKGLYDSSADKVMDQSWVSLIFARATEDRLKPAFVFTWARGKAAPTFKEISALLAGIKLGF